MDSEIRIADQADNSMGRRGRRIVDELECVASVMLAIVVAHTLNAQMIAWAAFSALVLMKGPIFETLVRSALRMIGTLLGATLAIWFERVSSGALWQTMLAVSAVGGVGLYGMLTRPRAYAWLLSGLTFIMIVLDRLDDPRLELKAVAITRVLEVAAGTAACLVISLASTLSARRWWPAPPSTVAQPVGWHREAVCHSAQAAIALAMLAFLHNYWDLPELAQAGITILAVMIVPRSNVGSNGLRTVGSRLRQRALGCLCGGLLAATVLLLAQGSTLVLIAGTCIGITIGRHIENGDTRSAYVGLQFSLAVIIVLVPDDYAGATIGPGLERLTSIFIGMAILLPILFLGHLMDLRQKSSGNPDDDRRTFLS